jgi:4-hydroxybenzoate polyprenyltransferase
MSPSENSEIVSSMLSVLRFYRVSDWLHFLGFTILGVLLGKPAAALSPAPTILIIAASAALLAYAYSFNDVFDRQYELPYGAHIRVNRIKTRDVLASVCPLMLGVIMLAQFSSTVLELGVLFSLLWFCYSYPRPRLRAVPIFCTAVNGVGFPILFLMGFQTVNADLFGAVFLFFALVLLEIPAQLIHEICHSQGDRRLGFSTTAVRYGTGKALQGAILALIANVILVAILLVQGFTSPIVALSLGSFAVIFSIVLFFVQRLARLNFHELRVKYRYGGIIAGVIIAISSLLGI